MAKSSGVVASCMINGVDVFLSKRLREFHGSVKTHNWTFRLFNEAAMWIHDLFMRH